MSSFANVGTKPSVFRKELRDSFTQEGDVWELRDLPSATVTWFPDHLRVLIRVLILY